MTNDTCWVVIQVGSAALKPDWRNYSALELEATCVVWSLETLAYYLKGCPQFDLWTDHSEGSQGSDTKNGEILRGDTSLQCLYIFCQRVSQPKKWCSLKSTGGGTRCNRDGIEKD